MIPLQLWAKREGYCYSQARKFFKEEKLAGACYIENRGKQVIYVPNDLSFEYSSVTVCYLCQRRFAQITGTHLLKTHGITLSEYKDRYPDAMICSADVSNAISKSASGRIRTDEHKANLSKSLIGRVGPNKGVSGIHKDTPETIEKKRLAQLGRVHSEETKQKIGDKHRGKCISPDAIEHTRQGLLKYYESHQGKFAGKKHSSETRELMAEMAIIREAAYTDEERAATNKKKSDANTGLKRTDEQKQTYREARVKWMSENPSKLRIWAGELVVAEWLDKHQINHVRQYLIPDCWHPFDFYVPDQNIIIEFDGAHHWFQAWFNVMGKTQSEREEMIQFYMVKDATESWIAGLNGYRIIRLRGKSVCGDCIEYGSLEEQLEQQGFDMPPGTSEFSDK